MMDRSLMLMNEDNGRNPDLNDERTVSGAKRRVDLFTHRMKMFHLIRIERID